MDSMESSLVSIDFTNVTRTTKGTLYIPYTDGIFTSYLKMCSLICHKCLVSLESLNYLLDIVKKKHVIFKMRHKVPLVVTYFSSRFVLADRFPVLLNKVQYTNNINRFRLVY